MSAALAIPMNANTSTTMSPANFSHPISLPSPSAVPTNAVAAAAAAAAVWPTHIAIPPLLRRPNLKRHASNDLPSGAVDSDIARARLTKRRATEDVVTATLERMSLSTPSPTPTCLQPTTGGISKSKKRSADDADLPEEYAADDAMMVAHAKLGECAMDKEDAMDTDASSSPRPLSPPIKARRTCQLSSPRAAAAAAAAAARANRDADPSTKAQNLQLTLFRPTTVVARRASGFLIDDTLVDSLRERLGDQLPAHVLASPAALAYLARTLAQGLPVPGRFLLPASRPMTAVAEEEEEEEEDDNGELARGAQAGMLRGKIEELPDDWSDEGDVKIQVAKGVPVMMNDDDDEEDNAADVMDQDSSWSGRLSSLDASPLLEEVLEDVEAMDLDD